MDEIELTRILMANEVTSPYFCGVVAHDQLNLMPTPKTGFFVCNTDDSEGPGKHWVVFAWTEPKNPVEFFDSLAKPPDLYHKDFVNFLINKGPNYTYSVKRIQAQGSIVCGEYCVFYAYHRCQGYSMLEILNYFSDKDLEANDEIVSRFVKSL